MNICTSGSLTTQACTKSGRISLHKERMTENTPFRAIEGIEICVYVLLHSESFSKTPGYGLFITFFLCQDMVAQNGYKVGTHHCYCDGDQVIILLFPRESCHTSLFYGAKLH